MIHSTAIIDKQVEIAKDTVIHPYTYIKGKVIVETGCEIGPGVYLEGPLHIGEGSKIYQGVSIGNLPQDSQYKGEITKVEIGRDNIIREFVTIHKATGVGEITKIGDHNLIMAYVHVAHNSKIGSHTIVANATQLAGFVEINDYAYISGLIAVHQFVRIGQYAIVGGGSRINQDVPPFFMAVGYPLRITGINLVGLKRHGFDEKRIAILKEAYKIIYRSQLNTNEALKKLTTELPPSEDVELLLKFIESSKRGITKRGGTYQDE